MKKIGTLLAVFLISITSFTAGVAADDAANNRAVVQTFYDFLSNPGSQSHASTFRDNVATDWQSIGNYSGKNKTADAFIGQLGHFSKLIPDMKWNVEEMVQAGNRVIVPGRATGTPVGPLFGVDGMGKSFIIMSIDIHTLENGKITKSYHVEDWAGALGQLKGK